MKKAVYSIFSICAFVFIGLFSSCEEEPCDLISCAYSGVCDAGACICQVGYEGVHCETIARDKFIDNGIYSVNEDGTLRPKAQYTATIEAGDQINEVRIKNFLNIIKTTDVIGTVSHDTVWIAQQDHNGYRIQGVGYITGKNPIGRHYYQDAVINFYYTVQNLSDNSVDYYDGTNGSQPSDWNKN